MTQVSENKEQYQAMTWVQVAKLKLKLRTDYKEDALVLFFLSELEILFRLPNGDITHGSGRIEAPSWRPAELGNIDAFGEMFGGLEIPTSRLDVSRLSV